MRAGFVVSVACVRIHEEARDRILILIILLLDTVKLDESYVSIISMELNAT